MDLSWQPVTGAAQRRRGRRQCAAWRHEQQSIAQALAVYTHHSAPRRQTMSRAGGWVREENSRPSSGRTHPPQAAGTEYFSLDVGDVPAAGLRSGVLAEPRPQERVLRHTVEHIVDLVRVAPMVQILDAPVPQTVDQLQDITRFFDTLLPVPEQVIEVPKILLDDVPVRAVLNDPQLAEQLVEVPTLVSSSLRLDAKEEDTIVAMASDAFDRTWFQVSGPRGHCWWWLSGSRPTQWDPPAGGVHRQARAV